jgi:PAS domain S-box-containing protein
MQGLWKTFRRAVTGRWLAGPLLLVVSVVVLELLKHTPLWLPHPAAFIMPLIIYTGLTNGLGPGLLTGALAWVYFAHHLSIPGAPFDYQEENLRRVAVLAVCVPALAVIGAAFKRRSETMTEISSANASLAARLRERERVEDALRDGEVRLVEALQFARSERDRAEMYLDITGVMMLALDFDGRITLINRRGCEILGYSESELLAKNWFSSFVPERLREPLVRSFREVISGARPSNAHDEYPVITRSGEERLIAWYNAALHAESGAIIGTLSSGADITEQKQQQARLKLALQAARMGTWEWDIARNQATRSEDTNALLGRSREQRSETFEEFLAVIHPEDRERLRREIESCLEDYDCVDYVGEYRVIWPDESIHWLADGGQVYRDASGAPLRLAGVTMDITARKQAEEDARLRQAELAHVMRISDVDEMATGLAHELNQPLTAVVNFAQGALRRLRTNAAGAALNPGILEAIEGAAAQAHRAGEIVRRLAKFVQKRQPQQTIFGINDAIDDVLELSAAEARDYEAVIQTDLDLENPCVSADNIQVQQVVLNLVRNGLEAMMGNKPGNRVLTIRTWRAGQTVHVSVADRGTGVSAGALKNLFQPFYTTKPHGMGLGLSISRTIIDAHGGRLWAANEPEGGAVFQFTLPHVLNNGEAEDEQRTDRVRCG